MDFHAMKRKELQALCKKHKIPANLTNLEMANRLASLLEIGQEQPGKTLGKSCLKSVDELGDVEENTGDVKAAKKVRFSREDQTFVFEKTNPRAVRLAARRRKSLMDEVQIQDEENVLSLVDPSEMPQKASEKAAADKRLRSTRTRNKGKNTEQADSAETELLQAKEDNGRKKTSQKRASSLVDSADFPEDPGHVPQKTSEKVVADKRVRSTRSRGRGKKTEQADSAKAELLQAEENDGRKKTSQKRAGSFVDSEVFPEDPGHVPQNASEKVVADKRVRSTRSRGRGKKTEQADAAEEELLQDGENHGHKEKSQKRVSSLVDSEVPSLMDDDEAKGVLRRSSRSVGKPSDLASLAKDQDAEKAPKRGLRSNRLKETHESSVDEAKEDVHETARITDDTRQKKRARVLNETASATDSDYVAEPPQQRRSSRASTRRGLGAHGKLEVNELIDKPDAEIQEAEPPRQGRSSRASTRRGLGAHGKVDGNEILDKSDAGIQEAEPPWQGRSSRASTRRGLGVHGKLEVNEVIEKSDAKIQEAQPPRQGRSSRASTRRGLGAHGKVDSNEAFNKSDAEIQEVGFLSSGEKSRKNDNACQPGKSDEPSKCDGMRSSLDAQTDVAGGSPLAKTASDAEEDQNLPYSSSKAAENYQGKDQLLCQTAPTLLLEECEVKNAKEESCKSKTGFGELSEASKAKTQLKNTSSTGKAVSTGGKQQRNSPFITSKEGINVDSYTSGNQNIEEDFKEADADKQEENSNRDTSEGAESLLLPSSGLKSAPQSVVSTVPAEDNKSELVTPVLEANSGVQCDPSLTSNNIEESAGPLSSQGTSQVQNEAASPIYVPEESEPNNASGEAYASKNIEEDDRDPLPNTTTIYDQCQSAFKTSTVDSVTSTAEEMQDEQKLIISGEEGITVDLYNIENQITKYSETARSDSFPSLLESQTRLNKPTDESAASPLMLNEPLHSQVDKCADHHVDHECSSMESKEALEGFTPSVMLGENSEGAGKFFGDLFDASAMLDQSSKQELDMNGSTAVDAEEYTENALEGSSPVEMLDDASEGAENFESGSLDEKIESGGSPEQELAVKSNTAGDTVKSIENEVERLSPAAMLYQSSEDANKSKLVNEGIHEDLESDGGPKQELAVEHNTTGDVVEPTENAAEVLNENPESAEIFINERADENTESDENTEGDAVESTENAVEGLSATKMPIENTEGSERFFSDVAGRAVESVEIAVEVFTPTKMLDEISEGAEKLISGSVDRNTEPDGSPKQDLDMNRDIAGVSVESTEAVEGSTHFVVINESPEGAEKFVCGKLDETNESDGRWNECLAMKSNPQPSVYEDASFEDPEERIELCPMEEGVHGNESSVARSDPEGQYMTETSGDEGEGHKEIVESGEWLYEAEICMEEVDLARKTDDLTPNGLVCSDIGGGSTAKVLKVSSPTSSRFSDRMELVAGSKERRELIHADYLDFKSPGPQSAFHSGDGAFRDESGETVHQTRQDASDEKISMHLCDYRDNSASNIQAEENMTAASEATEGQVLPDCFSGEPEPVHVRHTLRGEELENIACDQAAVDVSRSPEEKLKSAVKAYAQDENVKSHENGPTTELNVQSPQAVCPVEELHSAEPTRLGDLLGHGVLERTGGHGHVVDETAFSSDKSELYGGGNLSVSMKAEEIGEKQYKEAGNHYVEGLTPPAAKAEEMYEGVDSVASEKRDDTAASERSFEPENSGSQDFELTGYETALFMEDKFGDEADKPELETSERCWWISSTTDYSKKGGENGMEQAAGDYIKQGFDSADFPVLDKSAVCDKSELTEKKVALKPSEAKYEDVVHFEHCNAFEEDTENVECGMNGENISVDQQDCDYSAKDDSGRDTVAVSADFFEPCEGKNEDVVLRSDPCNVFQEDIGREECVMKDENHSMDQAEKDILEDLMKEDEMRLSSMDDDTLEGGGNKGIEDQVTAAYSRMFSMMPDDMFITADVKGTSEITNRNAENMQSEALGVTQVFATSSGSHPAEEKLKEGTLAEENVDGNENGEKETLEDLNHVTPPGNVDNLEDETASLDPMAGIIQELQEDKALESSMEDNKMAMPQVNDQCETSDVKDSAGLSKNGEAMPQQEETEDARRQEVNMSHSREPASLMNHKKRSIMIHGTPKRPIIASDMKENSAAHGRKELVADATAQRPLARRKALGELPRM